MMRHRYLISCVCIICLQRWDLRRQKDFPVTTPTSQHHVGSKRAQSGRARSDGQVDDSHQSFLGLKYSSGLLCLKVPCMSPLSQTNLRYSRHKLSMTVFSMKRKSEACFVDTHDAIQKTIILSCSQSLSTDALVQVNFCRIKAL